MANTDGKNAPKPPPHLHVSENEDRECDCCDHYLDGKCHLYNDLPVNGEWVCDDWKQGRNQDPDEDEEKATPRERQPKNLRDAGRSARQRFAQGRGEKSRDDSDD